MAIDLPGPVELAPNWARVANSVAYRHSRQNVIELIREFPNSANLIVPACPEWTVFDLAEHLAGLCDRAISLVSSDQQARPKGPPRSAPQTEPTGCTSLAELADYLARSGERLDQVIADRGEPPIEVLVMDAFTHEFDLRNALGVTIPTVHPAYPIALDLVTTGLFWSVTEHRAPALRIETPGASWSGGDGQPVATMSGHRYDVYRSIVGRRSLGQIAQLRWTSDPTPWLPAFTWGPFTPPEHPTEDLGRV